MLNHPIDKPRVDYSRPRIIAKMFSPYGRWLWLPLYFDRCENGIIEVGAVGTIIINGY